MLKVFKTFLFELTPDGVLKHGLGVLGLVPLHYLLLLHSLNHFCIFMHVILKVFFLGVDLRVTLKGSSRTSMGSLT